MERRLLIYGIGGLGVLGLALAAKPFLASLNPSDRARALLLPVDVTSIRVGDVKVLDRDDKRIYVVHLATDEFVALWVPTKDGIVMLPDMKWWRPTWPCNDFGPDYVHDGAGSLLRFTCRDPEPAVGPRELWAWNGEGRYIGPATSPVDDMPRIRFERTASQLLLKTSQWLQLMRWSGP
jgi:hypothetical protein